jgi:type III secretory pathway component EscU
MHHGNQAVKLPVECIIINLVVTQEMLPGLVEIAELKLSLDKVCPLLLQIVVQVVVLVAGIVNRGFIFAIKKIKPVTCGLILFW